MSIYIYIYLLLLLTACATIAPKRIIDYEGKIYYIMFIILGALLIFRYGQGSDYMNYKIIYNLAPDHMDLQDAFYDNEITHSEIGWKLLNQLFVSWDIPYEYLVIFVSIFELWMLNRYIKNYCGNMRCLSLLLLYPMFYLTYMFSALRQGLVMCVFLGSMLPMLEKRKWFSYILLTLLCSTIHSAALVFLLFLFVDFIKVFYLEALCFFTLILGVAVSSGNLHGFFKEILPSPIAVYLGEGGLSWYALAERVITAGVVFYMMNHIKDRSSFCGKIYKIYLIGANIYFLCCWMPLVASRLFYMWKFVEVAILAAYILKKERLHQVVLAFFVMISFLMFFKNVNAYLLEGNYNKGINFWNYPYIHVFDKGKLEQYRNVDFREEKYGLY